MLHPRDMRKKLSHMSNTFLDTCISYIYACVPNTYMLFNFVILESINYPQKSV